jgi:ribosome recycling factor
MLDEKSLESRMQKSVETLRKDLARVRTGLASPAMLDNVMVDYYGTKTPLPQMAAITVPEPRSLAIKPWDKALLPAVEKGILASDLGITPQSDGTYVRILAPGVYDWYVAPSPAKVTRLADKAYRCKQRRR